VIESLQNVFGRHFYLIKAEKLSLQKTLVIKIKKNLPGAQSWVSGTYLLMPVVTTFFFLTSLNLYFWG